MKIGELKDCAEWAGVFFVIFSLTVYSEESECVNKNRIQLFTLMWIRIRIKLPKTMRTRIRNPATDGTFLLNLPLLGPGLGTHEVREQIQ
jgi:hypothetical protein